MLDCYDIRNASARVITNSVIDHFAAVQHPRDMLGKLEFLAKIEAKAKSRAEMARAIKVAPPRITEMFKGDRDLSYDEAKLLADHFDIADEASAPEPWVPSAEVLQAILSVLLSTESDDPVPPEAVQVSASVLRDVLIALRDRPGSAANPDVLEAMAAQAVVSYRQNKLAPS